MSSRAVEIFTVRHQELEHDRVGRLRALFDREYLADHGDWDPDLPYGYARHDAHVIAVAGTDVVGHVGWGRRAIAVGGESVTVAGVGGVLVSPDARGRGLGQQLMEGARTSMLSEPDLDFGYLGCAESVASFYSSCGWRRIRVRERWINREGFVVDSPPGPPLFVLPIHKAMAEWPAGVVDLNGRAW